MNRTDFNDTLLVEGARLYRSMPWREDTRPYYILVSELMLQQTQVDRVIPKFNAFIDAFPDESGLASASLADVLKLWQGLGYNRRAKFLHEAAKKIVQNGGFPTDETGLLGLPGVGKNTAGAIRVYAYNQPALFVETNVRTVYFHHFFQDGEPVDDKQLLKLLDETLDRDHPREFYWALMDYGSWLKKQGVGRIQQSRHYKKQSALKGSVREIRGMIIAELTQGDVSLVDLQTRLPQDERFDVALKGLLGDGLISQTGSLLHLTK